MAFDADPSRLSPAQVEAIAGRVAGSLQARILPWSQRTRWRPDSSSLDSAVQAGTRDRRGFQRRRRFERAFAAGVSQRPGERLRFMTLPYPGGTRQDLRYALRILVKAIRRTYGAFEYKAVYEVGAKTGVGHLHVVFYGGFIAQGWLSHRWESLTGFAVVDIRTADGGSARYMAKTLVGYLTKGDPDGGWPMQSRGWVTVPLASLHERVLTELGRAKVHTQGWESGKQRGPRL